MPTPPAPSIVRLPRLTSAETPGGKLWKLSFCKGVKLGKKVRQNQKIVVLSTAGDEMGGGETVVAPQSGWIKRIFLEDAVMLDRLEGQQLLELSHESLCCHSIVIGELCADCGEVISSEADKVGSEPAAKIARVDAADGLSVTLEFARAITKEKISGLLKARRLILVLDLDNTLIHASDLRPPPDLLIDPSQDGDFATQVLRESGGSPAQGFEEFEKIAVVDGRNIVEETRLRTRDPEFPHYVSVSSLDPNNDPNEADYRTQSRSIVRCLERNVFRVETPVYWKSICGGGSSQRKSYMKLRPGVIEFLRDAAEHFELYIFTAGTKEHAESALKLLDPGGKFFGDRVYARSAVGADGIKSLSQILPTDHEMIVVVDDTTRAWSDRVGLFMCHPYMWHADAAAHFLHRPFLTESLIKARAVTNAVCQYSPMFIRYVFWRAAEQWAAGAAAGTVTAIPSPLPHENLHESIAGELELSEKLAMGKQGGGSPGDDIGTEILNPDTPPEISGKSTADSLWSDLTAAWSQYGIKKAIGKSQPQFVRDSDQQLPVLIPLLNQIHRLFYDTIDFQKKSDQILIPSCRQIIEHLRTAVLKGCVLLVLGDPVFVKTDLGKLSLASGAKIIFNSDVQKPTHIVTDDESYEAADGITPVVSFQWLEAACCVFWRMPEKLFSPKASARSRNYWDCWLLYLSELKNVPNWTTSEPDASVFRLLIERSLNSKAAIDCLVAEDLEREKKYSELDFESEILDGFAGL